MDLRLSWESLPLMVPLSDGGNVIVEYQRPSTNVDGIDRVALVASVDDQPVAVARLIELPGDAEIRFRVDEDYRRRGIGSILRDELLAIAHARGIYRFHANVVPDNVAIRRLL
ncbi:MAG TPA: GNAT family N-acetyltransferase, partial [Kofleriaceae bacterium]|nr:GNAT family N-acetyltransferase [Kofleriaceae bacterium]